MENLREIVKFNIIHESNSEPREQHYHQNLDMLFVLSGEVDVVIDDKVYELKPEDMILINSNKRHKFENSANLLAVRFEIDYYLLSQTVGTTQMLFLCNSAVDKNSAYDKLRHQMMEIIRYFYADGVTDKCYLQSLYYNMLHMLIANFMVKTDEARIFFDNNAEKERIGEIQNYIQGHYQSAISLNDLADKMFLSTAYLSKYIKKKFGMSFVDYLNNIRLFHAVDELVYTNKSLTHIAMDNGFSTSAAFNKSFKKVFNMSPGEYRKTAENRPETDAVQETKDNKDEIISYIENANNDFDLDTVSTKVIEADATQYVKYEGKDIRVINIGNVYMLLQQEAQNQVIELKEKLGITYVRVWNVFAKNTCVREDGQYSFHKLDSVLDFLTDNGIKLYMELGQKPTVLMYAPERFINGDAMDSEPYEFEYYKKMVKDLSLHLVNRYGIEEIENWFFEFWNNPALKIQEEDGDYYKYFDMVFNTFKKISRDIKIGGPGLVLGYEKLLSEKVFEIWKKREIQPDFISFNSFQYISFTDGQFVYGKKSLDRDYVVNQVAVIKESMKNAGFEVPEFHLDEWNYTVSNRNIISDSCEQAAYIMKNYIDMAGQVDVMAYWHGLDLYAEYYDTNTLLSGDSGLISRDGIKKPSFYAIEFLNKAYKYEVQRNENGMLSTNGRGSYTITCHNFKALSENYLNIEEDNIQIKDLQDYIEDTEDLQLKYVINNVQNGSYQIKTYYINQQFGSVQDLWKRLDLSKSMESEEIEFIKQHANPNMKIQRVEVSDGKLELEHKLKPMEVRFIEIKYQYHYE